MTEMPTDHPATPDEPTTDAGTHAPAHRGIARWGPWILLTAFVIYLTVYRQTDLPEGWLGDFDQAIATAAARDQKVLVAFHQTGCPPCIAMEKTVLNGAPVRRALAGWVPVRVDVNQSPDIANRFGIRGTPTFIAMTHQGKILGAVDGYVPADEFVRFLVAAAKQ